MTTILLFALVAGGGAALAGLARHRANSIWRQIAEDAGGSIEDLGGLGFELRAATYPMPIRLISIGGMLRIWSAYPLNGAPRFFLASPGPVPTPPAEKLMRTYGPAFAAVGAARVYSLEPARCNRLLAPVASLVATLPWIQIAGHSRTVELLLPAKLERAEADTALKLVALLTQADIFGVGALLALPSAEVVAWPRHLDDTETPKVAVHTPLPALIGPVMGSTAPCTAVTAASQGDDFRVIVRGTQIEGDVPPQVRAAVLRHFPGNGVLSREDNLARFQWFAIEEDQSRLLAGAKLVTHLVDSESSAGVYR